MRCERPNTALVVMTDGFDPKSYFAESFGIIVDVPLCRTAGEDTGAGRSTTVYAYVAVACFPTRNRIVGEKLRF